MNDADVKSLIQAGVLSAEKAREVVNHQGRAFLALPENGNLRLVSLDEALPPEFRGPPARRIGTVHLSSAESFIRYFNAFKGTSLIFAKQSIQDLSLCGVLNYHGQDNLAADRLDHRVIYTTQPGEDWKTWMAKDGKALEQSAFVDHLEECQEFIVDPPAAELIGLLENLQGKADASFRQAQNRFNGSCVLNYEEIVEVRGGSTEAGVAPGTMTVPTEFKLGLTPFDYGKSYAAVARLRIRVNSRKLAFTYQTVNAHLIIRSAAREMLAEIEAQTGVKPLLGTSPNPIA